ncbi:MAG: tetratricopeptide repeat-containing sulfotransferase family protein, partial [Gammaproteobacteria bacterium]
PLFRAALQRAPARPDALQFLGLLEFQSGRIQSGLAMMRKSVRLAPTNSQFLYNLASATLSMGNGAGALPQFRRCLELQPNDGDAHQGLALTLLSLQMPHQALSVLEEGLARSPTHHGCWMTLCAITENIGMLSEAVAAARHALELLPGDADTQMRLATLLLLEDRPKEAGHWLDKVIAAAPGRADAHFQRANLFTFLGQFAAARTELAAVLAIDPDYTEAYLLLSTLGGLPVGTDLQRKLEARVETQSGDPPAAQLNLRFALGKAWEDAGDYARAFHHFSSGNRLRRTVIEYSSAKNWQRFRRVRTSTGAQFLTRSANCGSESRLPMFIIGMPRSGTSLVEQVLSRHPRVHAGGELRFLAASLGRTLGASYHEDPEHSVTQLDDTQLRMIGDRCLADMHELAPQSAYVTDKLPANFLRLGLIHVLYPHAHILHCYRDPRDNCVSLFTTLFNTEFGYTSDLQELGEYYCEYYHLMRHWHNVLPPDAVLDVCYEDMVVDTESQVRRILDYCGLDWDPACLDFTRSARPVRTASAYQIRQPVYNSAVGRWKHYEPYIAPLLSALCELV